MRVAVAGGTGLTGRHVLDGLAGSTQFDELADQVLETIEPSP